MVPSKVARGTSRQRSFALWIMDAELSMPWTDPAPWARIFANSRFKMPSATPSKLSKRESVEERLAQGRAYHHIRHLE